MSPDQGTVAFNGSTPPTTLTITGPTANFYPSFDEASAAGTALPAGESYVVSFQWSFNSGQSVGATASIDYATIPGGNAYDFDSGGPGTSGTGTYTLDLSPGETVSFLLESQSTAAGKGAPTFALSDFSVQVIPEVNVTPWLEAFLFLPVFAGGLLKLVRRKVNG